ncbi:MAG: UDP-N-acetylglucosamine 2-epimerase [Muribaculum sp.]|nr:UDP-N-acetylglucosamine 2-epimerase [Muribaculum sp.]
MNERKPLIMIATGTRADWGLLQPLAKELCGREVETVIVATHAHFFQELGNTADEIRSDGFDPIEVPTRRDAAEATADAIEGFSKVFAAQRPDALVVLGDRFEILGAATAAMLASVPIVHIAGGNVTMGAFDNTIRNALSQMASLHLPETPGCAARLESMGIRPDRIVCAGSPGVYNAMHVPLMSLEELEESLSAKLGPDFLLATLHSATLDNETPLRRFDDFLTASTHHLKDHPKRNLLITYPNSDTDPAPLVARIMQFAEDNPGRVVAVPSLGRVRYLSAAALCTAVIGNSSSGIEETPSLGRPTLDIGVRQKGRERGKGVFHCEADTDSILRGLELVTSPAAAKTAAEKQNPYFTPDTPAVQAQAVIDFLNHTTSQLNQPLL